MFRADKPAFFWALGLLVLSLLVYRSILPAPATLSPYPADTFSRLGQSSFNPVNLSFGDRSMVMASLAANGDRILRNPLQPLGEGQCFPTPDAFTLGEPMLTTSYMAVPFYAATGEPILSYNILLILRLWQLPRIGDNGKGGKVRWKAQREWITRQGCDLFAIKTFAIGLIPQGFDFVSIGIDDQQCQCRLLQ